MDDGTTRKLNFHSERLNRLENTMANMEKIAMSIERTNERLCGVEKITSENRKFLFGNGSAGLDERMRNIERQLSGIQKAFLWAGAIAGGWLVLRIVEILAAQL